MKHWVFVAFAMLAAYVIVTGGAGAELLVWAGKALALLIGVYLCARLATAAFFASKRHYDERKKQ